MTTPETGVWVQTVDGCMDLFCANGDRWARADDRVYVYDDAGDDSNTVAEIEAAYFVSAACTSEESLANIETTDDDTNIPS